MSVISFKDCPFAVVSKISSSYQKSSRFCPTFYYNFILSYLLFWCVIHFELIFMTGIWSLDFFFHVNGCAVVPVPFVEFTVFVLLYCSCSFFNDQLTIFLRIYSWALFHWSICLFFHSYHIVLFTLDFSSSWSWVTSAFEICFSPSILCWLFGVFGLSI